MADPAAAERKMIENLREKTGKTLEQWVKLASTPGLTKHGEIVSFLKSQHALGHGYANLVAHHLLQSSAAQSDGENLVAAQYAEAKASLRPIYDALVAAVGEFGRDVELAPKKAYVSIRAAKQFAIIQPSTSTRVDVGVNLKGEPTTARLEASGSFNSMVSHRVRLATPTDVDRELVGWLRKAYLAAR